LPEQLLPFSFQTFQFLLPPVLISFYEMTSLNHQLHLLVNLLGSLALTSSCSIAWVALLSSQLQVAIEVAPSEQEVEEMLELHDFLQAI
jgi:hypothetical protein